MKVTVIPIVIGALGTIPKGLVKKLKELRIGELAEIIQTTTLLRSIRKYGKIPGDLRRLAVTHFSERPSADVGVKNPQGVMIIIIIYIDKNVNVSY